MDVGLASVKSVVSNLSRHRHEKGKVLLHLQVCIYSAKRHKENRG
jgi:hypothetical protein